MLAPALTDHGSKDQLEHHPSGPCSAIRSRNLRRISKYLFLDFAIPQRGARSPFPSAIPSSAQAILCARYDGTSPDASQPPLPCLVVSHPLDCCCYRRRRRRSPGLCIDGESKPSQDRPFLASKPPLSLMITVDHLANSTSCLYYRRPAAPPRPHTRMKPWS